MLLKQSEIVSISKISSNSAGNFLYFKIFCYKIYCIYDISKLKHTDESRILGTVNENDTEETIEKKS